MSITGIGGGEFITDGNLDGVVRSWIAMGVPQDPGDDVVMKMG